MAIDDPIFPEESLIELNPAKNPFVDLTSSGCVNPQLAVDDDPTTFAVFTEIPPPSPPTPPTANTYTVTPSKTSQEPALFNSGTNFGAGLYYFLYNAGAFSYESGNPGFWGNGCGVTDQAGSPLSITSIGSTGPISITTASPHGFTTGESVLITGIGVAPASGSPTLTGLYPITVTGASTFTLNGTVSGSYVNNSAAVTGGNDALLNHGLSGGLFATEAAAEAAAVGTAIPYTTVKSNPIGAMIVDSFYPDNEEGTTPYSVSVFGPCSFVAASVNCSTKLVELSWEFPSSVSISIDNNIGPVASSGSILAPIGETTTYTLSATSISAGIPTVTQLQVTVPFNCTRFLRADWGFNAIITRVRFLQNIPDGQMSTTGIDFESSLGYLEGERPPPDLPFAVYVPLDVGGGIQELIVDPPTFARGIVVFPDSYAPAGSGFPEVDLYQLQVYQSAEGENVMAQSGPNPTIQWATVGVQILSIYPWVQGSSYLTLPAASLLSLFGLQTFGISEASKSAIVTGGETVFDIEGFETGRELKIKITNELADMRYYYLVFNGDLVVDPADSIGPEVQYWVQKFTDRAQYVTVVAQGTNGDGSKLIVYPKCKVDGNFTFNMERDKVTDIDIEYRAYIDKTWNCQDGTVGAAAEWLWTTGTQALHS